MPVNLPSDQVLKLPFEALVFAGSLWLMRFFDASFLALWVFILTGFVLYWLQLNREHHRVSFFILWLSGYWAVRFLAADWTFLLALLFLTFLAYWVFGLGDLAFGRRRDIYHILNTALFFVVFIIFFSSDKSEFFVLKHILTGAAAFFLLNEFFGYSGFSFPKREKLAVAVLTMIALEFLWAVSLLPIGFVNSAALMTLLVFLMRDLAWRHFGGKLNRTLVLNRVSMGIILIGFILAASEWAL